MSDERPTDHDLSDPIPADLRENLQSFYQELNRIVGDYQAKLQTQSPPATLYHYTNDGGLRGIIETGKLWFTDIFYLNDPSELKYSVRLASDILTRHASGRTSDEQLFARDFARFRL